MTAKNNIFVNLKSWELVEIHGGSLGGLDHSVY
jgi:hypothetical protein